MSLSSAVFFEKNMISEDLSFYPSNEENAEGGLVYVIKIKHMMKNRGRRGWYQDRKGERLGEGVWVA